jgi:hypothetical protein
MTVVLDGCPSLGTMLVEDAVGRVAGGALREVASQKRVAPWGDRTRFAVRRPGPATGYATRTDGPTACP